MFILAEPMMTEISLYLFAVGAVFASFASLTGERTMHGASIIRPRSHCGHCMQTLSVVELIPIVSWFGLRGRCRHCHKEIPMRYPMFEALLGTVLVLSFRSLHPVEILVNFFLWFVMILAMTTDIDSMIVPNWVTLPSGVVFVCLEWLTSGSITRPLIGAAVGFGLILVVHLASRGKMGLGDAKLYLSIGAVLGAGLCVESFLLACAYGATLGGFLRIRGRLKVHEPIPFVPFIGLGVFTAQFVLPNLWRVYIQHVFGLHV